MTETLGESPGSTPTTGRGYGEVAAGSDSETYIKHLEAELSTKNALLSAVESQILQWSSAYTEVRSELGALEKRTQTGRQVSPVLQSPRSPAVPDAVAELRAELQEANALVQVAETEANAASQRSELLASVLNNACADVAQAAELPRIAAWVSADTALRVTTRARARSDAAWRRPLLLLWHAWAVEAACARTARQMDGARMLSAVASSRTRWAWSRWLRSAGAPPVPQMEARPLPWPEHWPAAASGLERGYCSRCVALSRRHGERDEELIETVLALLSTTQDAWWLHTIVGSWKNLVWARALERVCGAVALPDASCSASARRAWE